MRKNGWDMQAKIKSLDTPAASAYRVFRATLGSLKHDWYYATEEDKHYIGATEDYLHARLSFDANLIISDIKKYFGFDLNEVYYILRTVEPKDVLFCLAGKIAVEDMKNV